MTNRLSETNKTFKLPLNQLIINGVTPFNKTVNNFTCWVGKTIQPSVSLNKTTASFVYLYVTWLKRFRLPDEQLMLVAFPIAYC